MLKTLGRIFLFILLLPVAYAQEGIPSPFDFSTLFKGTALFKSYVGYIIVTAIVIVAVVILSRVVSNKISRKREMEKSSEEGRIKHLIENLKERRRSIEDLIEQARQDYFAGKMDEEVFKKRVDRYQYEMMVIDLELKKLKKR